jgi:hypothetical protein
MVSIWHFEKTKERICNTYSVQPKEMPFISKLKKIIKIYKEFCKVETRELQKEKGKTRGKLEEAQQDFQTFVHDPNKQMCLGALR